MGASGLRVVVTGLAATYPFGGVFWDYLQYPLGLRRLGHDVLYIEDTGKWSYDPAGRTFVADGAENARRLDRAITALDPGLADRWSFRDGLGRVYGRRREDVVRFCRSADLFVNLSGSCSMGEEYYAAERLAFVDSDPMYTQASVPGYLAGNLDQGSRQRIDLLCRHHVFFSFAENVGAPDCLVPTGLFDWIPTRQPVVLDRFAGATVPVAERRRVLTTVGSWEPGGRAPVVDGVAYGAKAAEYERFLALPSRSVVPLELALSGEVPTEALRSHGWRLADPNRVSGDLLAYRSYLARSLGEWSVAKHAYVASRSGWFSCRSACYLALGVPAVVQDTGFGAAIPTGEGVLAFTTLDDAAAAIEALASAPGRHAEAAREIAREHFDSDRVLTRLLDDAFATATTTSATTTSATTTSAATTATTPSAIATDPRS